MRFYGNLTQQLTLNKIITLVNLNGIPVVVQPLTSAGSEYRIVLCITALRSTGRRLLVAIARKDSRRTV